MKKQLVLILCLLLFLSACGKKKQDIPAVRSGGLSPASTASVTLSGVKAPEGYTAVARNDRYALFADRKTGDFAVWDFQSKSFTYSCRQDVLDPDNPVSQLNQGKVKTELASMLSIQYVQVSTITSTAVPFSQNSYAYSVKKGNVLVETIENGYRATFTFSDIDAKVPVEITLHDGGVTVRIVGEGLSISPEYRITSIDLLPGFMAGYEKNNGYLFIPSGSGAFVPLDSGRGETVLYRETVYGDDRAVAVDESKAESQQISVPVYGLKEKNHGIFAVITKGDATAEIAVSASSPRTCFTRVFSTYVTSVIDSTTLFESNFENQRVIYGAEERDVYGDYEVQYYFLSDKNASWVGMASLYREQLNLKKNPKSPQLMLTVYGEAQRKATFLGIPYQENFALTTFDGAKEMLADLYQSDITVSLRYVGWNHSGIQNKTIPLSFSPCGVLGGKSGLRKLTESFSQTKTNAYFDVDLMTFRKSGKGFSVYSDVCKSIFGTRTPLYRFMRSTYVPVNNENPAYLLTPGHTVTAVQEFLKAADRNKLEGLSLGDLGSTLYSDFSAKRTREGCLTAFKQLLADAAENHSLAFENANAYAYAYADRICSLPMTGDGNLLFSEDVPFLQLLLHGSVSYAAEVGTDLLDCIAYGADPQMVAISGDDSELMETSYNWLYGTSYQSRSEEIKKAFRQYDDVYKDLYSAVITDYRRSGEVSQTVFDNGTKVLVNRGTTAKTVDGVTVQPGGFTVVKEAEAS